MKSHFEFSLIEEKSGHSRHILILGEKYLFGGHIISSFGFNLLRHK